MKHVTSMSIEQRLLDSSTRFSIISVDAEITF